LLTLTTAALALARVQFPVIRKPILAHGSAEAHDMTIILSEQGLTDSPIPYLYQQFIQHTGVLHKVNNERTILFFR
jgi:hypothetical protein